MSGTFPLFVLILGAATVLSYSPDYGRVIRVTKRSTSQSRSIPEVSGGAGYPLQGVILKRGTSNVRSFPKESGGAGYPLQYVHLKRSTSQSRGYPEASGGSGYLLQGVTLKYLNRRPTKNPSCWFQYYTKCPKISLISNSPVKAAPPLSAGGGDSWQPVVVRAPTGSHSPVPGYKVMPGWATLNSVRLF